MIKFKNLKAKYDDKILFKELNLEVKKGEKRIISGPSGCGKSTLLKLACGFLAPEKGKIFINELKQCPSNLHKVRKHCSYASQQSVFDDLKVREIFIEASSFKNNCCLDPSDEKIIECLKFFNLDAKFIDSNVKDLSGGEKQRLSLALLLFLEKKIWFLDEISSGLDQENSLDIMEKISKLDITALIVSHDTLWINNPNFTHIPWSDYAK